MQPTLLIIRDGWGFNPHADLDPYNAVKLAHTPVADRISHQYPRTLIKTSGFDVGLPEDTMGNSEVGHQNMGAGRVVDQESVHITKQCRDGEIFENQVLVAAAKHAKDNNTRLHLLGIVSDAGVHGLLEHLYACLELARRQGVSEVFLHAFTDGRDTPPQSGVGYIQQIEAKMKEIGVGKIATVSGRFYAMDRDNRWQRVQKAYDALRFGKGLRFDSAVAAVEHYYKYPISETQTGDEFVTPSVIVENATIDDGDAVIFYNYRGDRPREITRAFVLIEFDGFDRGPRPDVYFATMTAYEQGLPVHVAYTKPPKMADILGDLLSCKGMKQFRCAETEKFPHMTFFFNDYREPPFDGEDREIIQSPRDVKTYDQKPEMSAEGVTQAVVNAVNSEQYALIAVNFANGDMVGHTGNLPAAIKACEVVDQCVGRILEAMHQHRGRAIITADHGNAEQMFDPVSNSPHTSHTTYPVELVVVDDRYKGRQLRDGGRLADVAPTLLQMMGIDPPAAMSGRSLIE